MSVFEELLDSLCEREAAMEHTEDPMARLKAGLYEFTEEDIKRLLLATAKGVAFLSKGDPYDFIVGVMTVGVEMGRELERRASL